MKTLKNTMCLHTHLAKKDKKQNNEVAWGQLYGAWIKLFTALNLYRNSPGIFSILVQRPWTKQLKTRLWEVKEFYLKYWLFHWSFVFNQNIESELFIWCLWIYLLNRNIQASNIWSMMCIKAITKKWCVYSLEQL